MVACQGAYPVLENAEGAWDGRQAQVSVAA